jgi:hypothetical protein
MMNLDETPHPHRIDSAMLPRFSNDDGGNR